MKPSRWRKSFRDIRCLRFRDHRTGRSIRRFGALLLGTCMLAAPAAGDRAEELARLQRAIAESRERVGIYEREHRNLFEAVEALDRAAAALGREVTAARGRVDVARGELSRAS